MDATERLAQAAEQANEHKRIENLLRAVELGRVHLDKATVQAAASEVSAYVHRKA